MRAKIRAELLRRCNICCRQAENSENAEGQQRYCHLFQTVNVKYVPRSNDGSWFGKK
ncbi:hypothetical protein JG688_00005103 [Phytophthora aleatoria]|uniref:Uncharacterized protein n=1 Tax=Phytophthora aleatoria TaxID=2496075 RepID=A0A8J5MH20_9STRA|nr:hypothetical protein JG688_00005103 [Phytophthora aleatoria]